MVDCHVHVFGPARFPYAPDTFYAPAGQELGTPARLEGVLDCHGVDHYADAGPLLADLEALDMIADVQVIDDQLVALSALGHPVPRVRLPRCGLFPIEGVVGVGIRRSPVGTGRFSW